MAPVGALWGKVSAIFGHLRRQVWLTVLGLTAATSTVDSAEGILRLKRNIITPQAETGAAKAGREDESPLFMHPQASASSQASQHVVDSIRHSSTLISDLILGFRDEKLKPQMMYGTDRGT
jgi:hypothetical protein